MPTVGLASQFLVLSAAFAQQDTNAPTTLKPVVVTGSLIPTAETVGTAPINIISAAQIEKSGSGDVLQLLRKLDPSFTGSGNLGQVANNFSIVGAVPAGEANIAIRNLPTLVLIDGRRLAVGLLGSYLRIMQLIGGGQTQQCRQFFVLLLPNRCIAANARKSYRPVSSKKISRRRPVRNAPGQIFIK